MLTQTEDEMEFLSNLFLRRAHLDGRNLLELDFFKEQIHEYLCVKNTPVLSLPEIDMICDLIEETFEEVESYIKETALGAFANIKNLLETIQIDFPLVEKDPVDF